MTNIHGSSKRLNMKKVTSYIIFVLLLYLFLFDPPFYMFRGSLRFSNLLLILAFIYNCFYRTFIQRFLLNYKREFFLFLLILLFIILRCIIDGELSYINKTLMSFLNIFMVLPFFFQFANKYGFGSEEQIVKSLMITCTVATTISIICLINPGFQSIVKFDIMQLSSEEYLYNNDYRGFGLASYLTSNYGYILGLVAGMGCFYFNKNRWFLFVIPFMIISGLINSRTSALIATATVVVYLISSRKFAHSILVGFTAFLFLYYFDSLLRLLFVSDRTYEWIMSFEQQMSDVAESGSVYASSVGSQIFGSMVIWPDTFEEWMSGRGYDIFERRLGVGRSDNGWIRQLNYGGLIYLTLFYTMIIFLLKRMNSFNQRSFVLIFVAVFSIVNTKTMCYPGGTLFALLMFFYFLKTNKTLR